MTFNLSNTDIESWTATQFWEIDPMQNEHEICRICIYVDWEAKTAEIETVMNTNSMPGRIWHGLASRYNLPEDTDFSKFQKFYEEKIRPGIRELETHFLVMWDGSNRRGYFPIVAREFVCAVNDAILDVPTHDYHYAFSLEDEFGSGENLVNYLNLDDIDLLRADLDNEETLTKIITSIEDGYCVFPGMSRAGYKAELEEIRERINEEA